MHLSNPARIAVIADIHGNSLALDAVLEDIKRNGGVEAYWFLGDYVAIGPDPLGVMQRLEQQAMRPSFAAISIAWWWISPNRGRSRPSSWPTLNLSTFTPG